MKHIFLAKKFRRIIAALIDLIVLTGVSAVIYFTLVYPNAFDKETYISNEKQILELYKDSQLFVCGEDGSYAGKSTFNVGDKVETLYDFDITHNNVKYENNCLTKDLYLFYTTLYTKYGSQLNLDYDSFSNQILKINTQTSNIASFDPVTYRFTLLDDTKQSTTVNYFMHCYQTASTFVQNSRIVNDFVTKNQQIVSNTLFLFFPVSAVVSFFTICLMPMLMPHGQTLGKLMFGYGVLDKNGYTLKKGWYIPRWLAYILFEYCLGIITFGGTFLISFTMFQFAKKRRCFHDKFSNSVVVDLQMSTFFDNVEEEKAYIKYKESQKDE